MPSGSGVQNVQHAKFASHAYGLKQAYIDSVPLRHDAIASRALARSCDVTGSTGWSLGIVVAAGVDSGTAKSKSLRVIEYAFCFRSISTVLSESAGNIVVRGLPLSGLFGLNRGRTSTRRANDTKHETDPPGPILIA